MATRKSITAKNPRVLTPEEDELLHKKADALLAKIRRDMLANRPFVGNLLMSLDVVPTRDIDNPTALTDGNAIYFDIAFLSSLTPDEAMFVFAHEVWHNVMRHSLRLETRDATLFNIAADLEINQLLVKDGFTLPKQVLMPKQFGFKPDLSAEQYYDLLYKKMPKAKGNAKNGESDGSNGSSGFGNGSKSGGNEDGELSGQFDKHTYVGKETEPSKERSRQDKFGKVGKDKRFRPQATESAIDRVRDTVIMTVQEMERTGRGEIPEHLKRLVNQLTEPEIKWQDVLNAHIVHSIGNKPDWNRPNRRFAYSGTYLSSHCSDKIRVAVGIDTSGSTSSSISKFLTEVNSIVKSFTQYELHIVECDAEVGKVADYDEDTPLDLENEKYEVTGGGGTVLHPIFDEIRNSGKEVDTIVIFTDGYTEDFPVEDDPGIPVLWVVTNDGSTSNFKFGNVVQFKES